MTLRKLINIPSHGRRLSLPGQHESSQSKRRKLIFLLLYAIEKAPLEVKKCFLYGIFSVASGTTMKPRAGRIRFH